MVFEVLVGLWIIVFGIVKLKLCGEVWFMGLNFSDFFLIDGGFFKEEVDLIVFICCIELCCEIGNFFLMVEFVKCEVMFGVLLGEDFKDFVCSVVGIYFYESCICKMGMDEMLVVDGLLLVYGIEKLLIVDVLVML